MLINMKYILLSGIPNVKKPGNGVKKMANKPSGFYVNMLLNWILIPIGLVSWAFLPEVEFR